nr:hypothetical protein [Synechococcus sp. RS9916]
MGPSEQSGGPISISTPSFVIAGAAVSSTPSPRWDRVNSQELIARARAIYFRYLSEAGRSTEPTGVVLCAKSGEGRVVFEMPTLLPDEDFLSTQLLRGKATRRGPGRA